MSENTNQSNVPTNGVKSPEKKSFLSGMKSSFGSLGSTLSKATSSVTNSVTTAVSDANVATPRMEQLGAENRYDIEDDTVHSEKKCYIYVSCAVGKEIRDKIKMHLEEASKEFNSTLGKLEEPTGSIKNIQKFSIDVGSKFTNIQNAKAIYDKKSTAVIPLNTPLDCKLSVKKDTTLNAQGEPVTKVNGKILEINLKSKTLKVEGSGYIKTSKGIIEKKVKMSTVSMSNTFDVNIADLCVGGATADDNDQGQCFKQSGGGKKSYKSEILEITSDMGICE